MNTLPEEIVLHIVMHACIAKLYTNCKRRIHACMHVCMQWHTLTVAAIRQLLKTRAHEVGPDQYFHNGPKLCKSFNVWSQGRLIRERTLGKLYPLDIIPANYGPMRFHTDVDLCNSLDLPTRTRKIQFRPREGLSSIDVNRNPNVCKLIDLSMVISRVKIGDHVERLWLSNMSLFTLPRNMPLLTQLGLDDCMHVRDRDLLLMPALTELDLSCRSRITDRGLQTLTRLTSLGIHNNNLITNDGICHMHGLVKLRLGGNTNITNDVFASFQLTELGLEGNTAITCVPTTLHALTLANVDYVAKLPVQLRALILAGNSTIDDSKLMQLSELITLSIAENYLITNDAVSRLTTLTDLDISGVNNITDVGIRTLTNLKRLHISGNNCICVYAIMQLPQLTHVYADPEHLIYQYLNPRFKCKY